MFKHLGRKVSIHALSHYILTRGLVLTAFFPIAALVLTLCSGTWLARWYAEYLISMGGVLLGVSLLGPLLIEDILRKKG